MNQPNDLAIAPDGTLYASDPNWKESTGQLWRIDRDGKITLLAEGMGTTNGIEVSPDGKTLYVNESVQRNIWAFDITPDGTLANKRLLKQFAGPRLRRHALRRGRQPLRHPPRQGHGRQGLARGRRCCGRSTCWADSRATSASAGRTAARSTSPKWSTGGWCSSAWTGPAWRGSAGRRSRSLPPGRQSTHTSHSEALVGGGCANVAVTSYVSPAFSV